MQRAASKRGRYARSQETRIDILRAAERLFGLYGIENTSMRMVATAAGQANVAAVQYHFGSKEGLIAAIFDDRVLEMEPSRRRIIEQARGARDASLRQLLEAVFLPYLDLVDENGAHVYARMLLDYLTRFGRFKVPHPALGTEGGNLVITEVLDEIDRRLAASYKGWEVRFAMMVAGFLSVVNEYDIASETDIPSEPLSVQAEEMLDVMVVALKSRDAEAVSDDLKTGARKADNGEQDR